MDKYNVATVQMEIKYCDKKTNVAKALRYIDEASRFNVKLVCLPGYFNTGWPQNRCKELAEPIPGPTINQIAAKAKEHRMYIVAGSIIENGSDSKLYKTITLIGPNGEIVGKYRESHFWGPRNELKELTIGLGDYPVFSTEIGAIGIMGEGDIDMPEVPRILALKGAEIICVPLFTAATPLWETYFVPSGDGIMVMPCYLRVYAHVNLAYVISSNNVGNYEGFLYLGTSRIVSPLGEFIGSAGESERVAVATIDLALIRRLRSKKIFIRRPETYGTLIEKGLWA